MKSRPNIFTIDQIDVSKLVLMNPTNTNNLIIPICYMYNNLRVPLLIQMPALLLNDKYKENSDELFFPIFSKTDILSTNTSNFLKLLDSTFVSLLGPFLSKLKTTYKLQLGTQKLSYRAIVNDIDDQTNHVYKNGLIRLKILENTKIYDCERKMVNKSEYSTRLIPGVYMKSIIEFHSILIEGGDISILIKPHQLRLSDEQLKPVELNDYSFVDSDSPHDKEVKSKNIFDKLEEAIETNIKYDNMEDDSDANSVSNDLIDKISED
jgi:molecular chaperone DnaK (HSP70)